MALDKFYIFSQAMADIISFSENDEFRYRCFECIQVRTCSEVQNKLESKLRQLQGQRHSFETSDTSANMQVQPIKEPPNCVKQVPLKCSDLPTSKNHYEHLAYTTLASSPCTNNELMDNQPSSERKLKFQEGVYSFQPICQGLLQVPLSKSSTIDIIGNHDLLANVNLVNSQKSLIERHEESLQLENDQKFERIDNQNLKKIKPEKEREQIVTMDTFQIEDGDFTFDSPNSPNFDLTFDSKSNSLLLNEFHHDLDNSNLTTSNEEMYGRTSAGLNNDKKDDIYKLPKENFQNNFRISKILKPAKLIISSQRVIDDKNENDFCELNHPSSSQNECKDFSCQSFKITSRFPDLLESKETITELLYISDNINKIQDSNENETVVSDVTEQDLKSYLDSIQLALPVDQSNLDMLMDPTNDGNSTENVHESIQEELLDPISDYHWSDEIMKQVEKELEETKSTSEILDYSDYIWSEELPKEVSKETIVNKTFTQAQENYIDFAWYD